MKNIKKIIYLLMVVGVLSLMLGCPNEPPDSSIGTFTYADENIGFHDYYAKLTYSRPATVTMVVSESSSPPAYSSISHDAHYTRKFEGVGKPRPIFISWTDQFTTASWRALRDESRNQEITTENASTKYNDIGIIKPNTQYYLHWYELGGDRVSTSTTPHTFTTFDYPTSSIEAAKLVFEADTIGDSGDAYLIGALTNGIDRRLRSLTLERKTSEPLFYSAAFISQTEPVITRIQGYDESNRGACRRPPNVICQSYNANTMLVRFSDHSLPVPTGVAEDFIFLHAGWMTIFPTNVTANISPLVWHGTDTSRLTFTTVTE